MPAAHSSASAHHPGPARSVFAGRLLATCVLAGLASGCFIDTQLYPGVLEPKTEPLPPGAKATFERGAEEAFVIRHSDPVSVRIAETNQKYDLAFYEKRTRVPAGSWVYCGPAGHAEVILPGATQVSLFGRGSGVVGTESRREPTFTIVDTMIAVVIFGENGQVQIPGGALLEARADSGPFVVETIQDRVLRVRNRSSSICWISFRDDVITLEPSESVDLALLDSGSTPFETDPSSRAVLSDAGRLELRGEVDVLASPGGTQIRATGEGAVEGLGLRMTLHPGDEVRFEAFGSISSDEL